MSFNRLCAFGLLVVVYMPAHAFDIHRCRLPSGQTHFTDGECPAASRTISVEVVAAPPRMSEDARRQRADADAWQKQNRAEISALVRSRAAPSRGAASAGANRGNACESARKRRDRIRDKDFKTMTFDRAVALDDAVREACR